MAARVSPSICSLLIVGMGAALGWLAEPVFTPDAEPLAAGLEHTAPNSGQGNDITAEWLPIPELEQRLNALSADESNALLTTMPASFWCSHPNGRPALRILVQRLGERHEPAQLAQKVFGQFRSWDLPTGARVETLRNLIEALAAFAELTPEIIGGALHGSGPLEIHVAAAAFIQQRRGSSMESDFTVVRRFLVAAGLEQSSLDSAAGELTAAAWFAEGPPAAIAFSAKTDREFSNALRPLLRQLYALDPPAAVAAFRQIAANGKRSYWTGEAAFLTGLSAAEFRDVLAQLPKEKRVTALQGFAVELALQAPGDVHAFVQQFSATDLYASWSEETSHWHHGQVALLRLFAERDPAACREWLASLPAERRVKMIELAAFPTTPAYARFCLADPDFHLTGNNASPLLHALASEDRAAAFRELSRVPESHRKEVETSLHAKIILDSYAGDIVGTLQALEEVPEHLRNNVRAGVYPFLALRFQRQIAEWVAANAESPQAPILEVALAERNAFHSAAEREAILSRSLAVIEANPAVASMAESHIRFLAETNPMAATQWFARIPDGKQKASIVQGLVQEWAKTDTAAAAAWAEALPPSPTRDSALLQLANVQRSEPEQALQRISQITGAEQRFITAKTLVHQWALVDDERAMAMIAEIAWSDEQRRKLEAVVHASPTRIRRTAAP